MCSSDLIPRRLMVADADHFRATAALRQAEEEIAEEEAE